MLRLNITSKDGGKYWLEFSSQADADAYKEKVRQSAHWGKPAWTEIKEVKPAIRDEVTGEIVTPPVTEEIKHPAEYTITEEDISAEIAAKKSKADELAALSVEVESLKKKSGNLSTAELTKIVKFLLG